MKGEIDYLVEHGGDGLVVMGMSVGNGARGGSHLHLHGTAGDDPFAGLQPGLDGYFAAVVVADFHFASLVSFLVELHIYIIYALVSSTCVDDQ